MFNAIRTELRPASIPPSPNMLCCFLYRAGLALLSGLILSIAFLDHQHFYLSWLAFVPLLFATKGTTPFMTYALGIVAGLALFASGTYWIADFIRIARGPDTYTNLFLASLYWLYCAHMIALMFVLFNWLKTRTKIHEFLLFPSIVAIFTASFHMVFAMRLGESQVHFHSALQATSFFGVQALDAVIALCNILLFRLMSTKRFDWPSLIALALIALWLGYGKLSFDAWETRIANWNTIQVGLVQPNETPTASDKASLPGYSRAHPPEMAITTKLAQLGADLVVWPEGFRKDYLNNLYIEAAYQKHIEASNTHLVFQDIQQQNSQGSRTQYNAAVSINPAGKQTGVYHKLKRIPFGEYLPLLSEGSKLKTWLRNFLGGFLNEFEAGKQHAFFTHEKATILPLICYETTFPGFVGRAVQDARVHANAQQGMILLGLSNDGWFGSTHQPYQHIMASSVRAVENRLPLVHVANNGPSIVVTPNGNVIFKSDFQKAGGYVTEVPYSETARGSFYSRHPQLFTNALYVLLFLSVISAILRTLLNNR